MTDTEFDILDELYFVQSFEALTQVISLSETEIRNGLQGLLEKGWIKCFASISEEVPGDEVDFENKYQQYYYLATKAGLLAHNSR
jgi:DNA-binding Lrp family transcriptional regulator